MPMETEFLESTMLAVIRLELPEGYPTTGGDAIGAFVNGPNGPECIGQAHPIMTDQGRRYFLTLFGELSDERFTAPIHFMWHSAFSETEFRADETLLFEAMKMHGNLDDPFILRFTESMPQDRSNFNALTAYPNPFRDELTIQWFGEEEPIEIRVENALGQVIDVLDCRGLTEGPCTWVTENVESGLYLIQAVTDTRSFTVKVIK